MRSQQIETKRSFGGAMSDLKPAHVNSAAVLRTGTGGWDDLLSKRYWRSRLSELKVGNASFRVAALSSPFICCASGTPVMARGGGHGIGGFGMHGGHLGAGGAEGLLAPSYVLITVSKITDAETFKAMMRDLAG